MPPVASEKPAVLRGAEKKSPAPVKKKMSMPRFSFGLPHTIAVSKRLKFVTSAVLFYSAVLITVSFFASAEVNIALKSESFAVDRTFSAGSVNSEILAEKAVLEDAVESSAKTFGIKDFNERSAGSIIIYNAYSSEPQALVANTRFETPDGKIYRITKSLTVPGAKIVDGKIEPSSIGAVVFAEVAGEEYNIGLADFTVPGFKGSAKYEKFYARSKTPMTGGFVGKAKVVSEKDVEDLRKNMEEKLKNQLYYKMQAGISEDLIIPEGAYGYEIKTAEVEPALGAKAEEFRVVLRGALKSFFVRRNDISKRALDVYKNDPHFENIEIPNFSELKISALNPNFESETFKLKVSGQPKAVWTLDNMELAESLVLASGSAQRLAIFEKYPQIRRAEVAYYPSWWKIFPDKAERVEINETY